MALNNINVKVVATADTRQARQGIRQLSREVRQANRLNRQALTSIAGSTALYTQPVNQVRDNMDRLVESTRKGKITFDQFRTGMRNSQTILQRQAALYSSAMVAQEDYLTGKKRGVLVMDDFNRAQVTLGQRLRLGNTLLRAYSTSIVDFGKNLQWAGRQITVGFTMPFALAGAMMGREFMNIEEQIVRFRKVYNDNINELPVDAATERIVNMSKTLVDTLGTAQQESLETAATFAQMGKSTEEIERLTTETQRLAKLGEAPPEQATQLVRTLMANQTALNGTLEDTINLFNMIENTTATTIQDIVANVPEVIAQADQLGLSATEVTAIIAGMNETLGSAKEATTALRFSFNRMLNPTREFLDKFQEITGLDFSKDVLADFLGEGGTIDITGVLGRIGQIVNEMENAGRSAEEIQTVVGDLFGARQTSRMLTALNSINDQIQHGMNDPINDFGRAMQAATADTDGLAEAASRAQSEVQMQVESTGGQFRQLINQIRVELAEAGEPFVELANSVLGGVKSILEWFTNLDKGTQKLFITVGAVIAAFGGVVMLAGIAVNAFGMLTKVFTGLFDRLRLTNAEIRAADLAMDMQSMSARDLLQDLLGVNLALENMATNQQKAAAATKFTTDRMRVQASAAATSSRVLAYGGGWAYPGIGTQIGGTGHRPQSNIRTRREVPSRTSGIPVKKGMLMPVAGLAAGAAMMGGDLGGQGMGAATALIALNAITALQMALPAVKAGIVGIGKGIAAVGGNLAKIAATFKSGGILAGFKSIGAIIGVGGGGIVAGVAAVGVGLTAWYIHSQAAKNEMNQMAAAVDGLGEAVGQDLSKVAVAFKDIRDEAEGSVEEQARLQEAVRGVNDQISLMSDLSDDVQSRGQYEMAFNLAARSDFTIDELKAILSRSRLEIGIDVTSIETKEDLMDAMSSQLVRRIEDAFDDMEGNLGPAWHQRITGNNISDTAEQLSQFIGSSLTNALASMDADVVKAAIDKINEELSNIDSLEHRREIEGQLVASLVEQTDAVSNASGKVTNMAALINELNYNVDWLNGNLGDTSDEMVEVKNEITKMLTDLSQGSGTGSDLIRSFNEMISEFDNVDMQELREAIADIETGFFEAKKANNEYSESTLNAIDAINDQYGSVQNLRESLWEADVNFTSLNQLISGPLIDALNRLAGAAISAATRQAGREGLQQWGSLSDMMEQLSSAGEDTSENVIGLGEAAEEAEDAWSRSIGNLQSNISEVLQEFIGEINDALDKERESIEESYDKRLKALDDTMKAEKERDDMLQKFYQNELDRQRRLNANMQNAMDIQRAIARGELDRAAELQQENIMQAKEDALAELKAGIEERDKARQQSHDDEKERLEEEKAAALDTHDTKVETINAEIEELQRTTPATLDEWKTRVGEIESIVEGHGFRINNLVAEYGTNGFRRAIMNWKTDVLEDNRWQDINDGLRARGEEGGKNYVEGLANALLGGADFAQWAGTGGAGGSGGAGGGLGGAGGATGAGGAWGIAEMQMAASFATEMRNFLKSHGIDADVRWSPSQNKMILDVTNRTHVTDHMLERLFGPRGGTWEFGNVQSTDDYVNDPTTHTDNRIPNARKGGYMEGFTGSGRRAMPAMLHGGEFVLHRDAVSKIGLPALEAMNAPSFRTGGFAGDGGAAGLDGGIFGLMNFVGQKMSNQMNMMMTFMSMMMGGRMSGMMSMFANAMSMMSNAQSGPVTDSSPNYGGTGDGGNPVPGGRVISEFGASRGGGSRSHLGIDIGAPTGTPIYSAFAGTVTEAGTGSGGFGTRVWVHSPHKGLYHAYAHMNSLNVRKGHQLPAGYKVGTVGQTGNARTTPPHLHWSANPHGDNSEAGSINPRQLLQLAKGGRLRQNNVIANLHKGETVLRAPVAASLERGIQNLERRGGDTIVKLEVGEFHGTEENMDRLVSKIEKALDKKQNARGRQRRYG